MSRLQLNIVLSQAEKDILDAAVFVRELRSAQDLVSPAVRQLVLELGRDEAVRDAVALRAATRPDDAEILSLGSTRRRKPRDARAAEAPKPPVT